MDDQQFIDEYLFGFHHDTMAVGIYKSSPNDFYLFLSLSDVMCGTRLNWLQFTRTSTRNDALIIQLLQCMYM